MSPTGDGASRRTVQLTVDGRRIFELHVVVFQLEREDVGDRPFGAATRGPTVQHLVADPRDENDAAHVVDRLAVEPVPRRRRPSRRTATCRRTPDGLCRAEPLDGPCLRVVRSGLRSPCPCYTQMVPEKVPSSDNHLIELKIIAGLSTPNPAGRVLRREWKVQTKIVFAGSGFRCRCSTRHCRRAPT